MMGILLAVSILLLQIRNYFALQQKIIQGDALYSFKTDMEALINSIISSSGNSYINYKPMIKKYSIIVGNQIIEIKDKISGKKTSFSVNFDVENSEIEDSDYICISKVRNCDKNIYILSIKQGFCEILNADCIKYEGQETGNSNQPSGSEDCADLTDNCATGEIVLQKIACEAKKAGVPADIIIGIAMTETGGHHCDKNGNVILGDNGKSIGIMQTSQCKDTGDVHNINENIRCAIKKLIEKCEYSKYYIIRQNIGECKPTGYCTNEGVRCVYCYNVDGVSPKVYQGWDIAIRGYNGWGSCEIQANYNYVETVKKFASQYTNYN
jgi:hypothetical protein